MLRSCKAGSLVQVQVRAPIRSLSSSGRALLWYGRGGRFEASREHHAPVAQLVGGISLRTRAQCEFKSRLAHQLHAPFAKRQRRLAYTQTFGGSSSVRENQSIKYAATAGRRGPRPITAWYEGLNLGERFKAGKTDLPFLVLIFDEFADLILAQRDDKKEFEKSLVARIAGKGRAAGIHLVLATQRPDRAVVTGLIKDEPSAESVPQGR